MCLKSTVNHVSYVTKQKSKHANVSNITFHISKPECLGFRILNNECPKVLQMLH